MKIGLLEVKQALKDHRFLDSLPISFQEDITKYLSNPSCGCNLPFYKRVMAEAADKLKEYYPNQEIQTEEENVKSLAQNNYSVINCHINELADQLKKFPVGRKQIAIARYEDQVTVIMNELNVVF